MWGRCSSSPALIRSLFGRAIGTRLQQESKPRNARREIFVFACAEIPHALRLCRKLDPRARQEQAQNGEKIDAAKRAQTTMLSIAYTLAGAGGLEPPNGGIKIRCLTTWLRPIGRRRRRRRSGRTIAAGCQPINGRRPLGGGRPVDRRGAGARLAPCNQAASTTAMGMRSRLRSAPRSDAGG
jgi:hypothetical protein